MIDERRESETLEFKETTKELKQGVISLTSMLNKHGEGTVLFGIRNDGEPSNRFIIGESTSRDVSTAIRDHIRPTVTPEITIEECSGRPVIRLYARDEGHEAPYSAYDRYYIRSDDEDLPMTPSQLRSLFEKNSPPESSWERRPSGHSMDCVDEDLLMRYIERCNSVGRLNYVYDDMRKTLTRLGLLYEGDELNNAGFYLFSDARPLTLKLAVFVTDERLSFADIDQYQGNILGCIERGEGYIKEHMDWRAEIIDMKRAETPEVPIDAVREIVINSFAHMRYGSQPFNEIVLTPTRIEVTNPGTLPDGYTPDDFAEGRAHSILRNPVIANALYLDKSIDRFGTGFRRVFVSCKAAGAGYSYDQTDRSFTFAFQRKRSMTRAHSSSKSGDSLESGILELINGDPSVTIYRISEDLSADPSAVQRSLNDLRSRGIIERVGAKKNGEWRIIR